MKIEQRQQYGVMGNILQEERGGELDQNTIWLNKGNNNREKSNR